MGDQKIAVVRGRRAVLDGVLALLKLGLASSVAVESSIPREDAQGDLSGLYFCFLDKPGE